MNTIINRLRWLSLGVYLGAFIMCFIETYSKDDDKKIDLTRKWSDYKHNHDKDEEIRKMVDKWPQPFDSGIDHPPLFNKDKK
jgi:hypothetical protein